MLGSRVRASLPLLMPLKQMGTAAVRTAVASKEPELLPAALAFEDPRAFQVKTVGELLRALGVFRLCSIPVLVNNCGTENYLKTLHLPGLGTGKGVQKPWFVPLNRDSGAPDLNSSVKLMSIAQRLLGKRGFSFFIRPTVYAQFVAGENETEISQSMEKMSLLGLRPMLAVPIEEDLGESTGEKRYEDNMEAMLECVRMSHSNAWSKDPMMQLKITALLSPELCVKLTSLMAQQPYDLKLLVRAMDGEPISFPGLDDKDNAHLLCGLRRLNKIGEASVNKVRVLVDAEYTYMNPALSLVTMAMMKKFNKDGTWIWNTYQCYLKESRSLLLEDIELSKKESFYFGVKLVRGAYMDKERKVAQKEGRQSPVHNSWTDTNDSYNGSLNILLQEIAEKPENYRIIVATHNEESVRLSAQWMEELGIDKDGGSVCFGQLLGMCDHVSLTLAKEGYAIYKSVPYGSVDDTLPYLVRRAQENRTVLQGIRKERDLLRQELRRRLRKKLGTTTA